MDITQLWAHISAFDDPIKTELANSIKYAAAALPVAAIGSETIRRTMHDDKEPQFIQDSFANAINILVRLVAVIGVLFAANRFATYFVPDGDYRVVAHLVMFLVMTASTVGTEVRELVRRYMGEVELDIPPAPPPNQMTGPNQFLPHPQIREPTTSTGADIRAPPAGGYGGGPSVGGYGGVATPSVGPGMQPNFNDMY